MYSDESDLVACVHKRGVRNFGVWIRGMSKRQGYGFDHGVQFVLYCPYAHDDVYNLIEYVKFIKKCMS